MKYKREIHLNFDVPWWLLLESLVHIFAALYNFFFEDRNKEYLLKKVKQFARFGFLRNLFPMFNNIFIYIKIVSKY